MNKKFNIKSYDINLKKNEIKFALDCLKKNEIANGSYKKKFENSLKKITKSVMKLLAQTVQRIILSLKYRVQDNMKLLYQLSVLSHQNAIKYNNANPVFMDIDELQHR